MLSIPISAFGVDAQIKLTQPVPPEGFPILINQAGSYVLTSNISLEDPNLNAIEITVNDVTLDLNGHKIQGPNTESGNGFGIYAANRYSITVKNGRIWGFGQRGIFLSSGTAGEPSKKGAGHIIEHVQAMNNTLGGIYIAAGLVRNCTANNNGAPGSTTSGGIYAENSTITNCTANNNTGEGIAVINSTVTQCTANYNYYGIHSLNSIIKNCTSSYNSASGIWGNGDCYIVGNNLRYNVGYGLLLFSGGDFAIRNVASDNGQGNFYTQSGNYLPTTGDNANYGF